jgi:hypothetical protein
LFDACPKGFEAALVHRITLPNYPHVAVLS